MWIEHWVFSPVVLRLHLGCKTWLVDSRVIQPEMWSFKLSVALSCTDDAPRDPSLLLILKWGGELTPAGRIQAENLGKAFRTLYPGGQGEWVINPLSVVWVSGQNTGWGLRGYGFDSTLNSSNSWCFNSQPCWEGHCCVGDERNLGMGGLS